MFFFFFYELGFFIGKREKESERLPPFVKRENKRERGHKETALTELSREVFRGGDGEREVVEGLEDLFFLFSFFSGSVEVEVERKRKRRVVAFSLLLLPLSSPLFLP